VTIRDRIWPFLISALGAFTFVVVLIDLSLPLRAPVVLAFATICPGMALVRLLRLDEPLTEFLLAIVVSLCVAGVLATIAVYLGAWDPRLVLVAVVELTLTALLVDLVRPGRSAV
jgi:phage shock protein PspC (stress-responsive transcriptional regulator)